jgi:hypothetical protein
MESIKSFQRYIIDNGLLFEINRRILHPVGLALVIDIDRNNRKQLAFTELLSTDDSEGFLFDEEAYEVGDKNYKKFLLKKGGQSKINARKEKYGFVEQDKADCE